MISGRVKGPMCISSSLHPSSWPSGTVPTPGGGCKVLSASLPPMKSVSDQKASSLTRARALLAVCTAVTLVIMALIFWMSAQEGGDSSSMSDAIAQLLINMFFPAYDAWQPDVQADFFSTLTHIVRKAAHMAEYALLAASAALTLLQERRVRKLERGECPEVACGGRPALWRRVLAGWAIASAYAATDEFHQLFVPGRSALVSDVAIDAAGAAIGALIVLAVKQGFSPNLWQKFHFVRRTSEAPPDEQSGISATGGGEPQSGGSHR